MKPSMLAIELGTDCDNRMLLNSIYYLRKKYQVICLTDEKNKLPSDVIKYTYKTPAFFLEDANLELADPSESIIYWAITNPTKAYDAAKWTNTMRDKVIEIIKKHADIKALIILYPAFPVLIQIPENIIASLEVFVLYYAPAFPNKEIPWIFDSKIKSTDFKLFKKDPKHTESTFAYFKRIALFSGQSLDDVINKFSLVHNIIAWDTLSVHKITPSIKEMHVNTIGAIIDWPENTKKLPVNIDCISNKKQIIFVTFGSYTKHKYIKDNISILLSDLEIYCKKNQDTHVIYHNGNYNSDYVTSFTGYIPYQKIVPKCKLVIFTGSLCLQNICLYHKTPMLFVPLLTEQYFWAKNYTYHTGIKLYDFKKFINIDKILTSVKVAKYLKTVSNHMLSYDSRKKILDIIDKQL
jgi:hypothetical protein